MSRIVKRPRAQGDIEDIAVYIGQHNPKAADRFVDSVEDAMGFLAEMPELGSLCEFEPTHLVDVRSWTLRKFRKYVILYRPLEDGIEVIRVTQGSQELETLLK